MPKKRLKQALLALLLVFSLLVCLFPANVSAEIKVAQHPDGTSYVVGKLCVTVSKELESFEDVQKLASDYGCTCKAKYTEFKYTFFLDNDDDTIEVKEALEKDPRVAFVEYDRVAYIQEPVAKEYSGNSVDWSQLVPGEDYRDGEVIVTFEEGLEDQGYVYDLANLCGCEVDHIIMWHEWKGGKVAHFTISDGSSVSDTIARLEENDLVRFAENNAIYKTCMAVNDAYAGNQWHLNNIHIFDAWDIAQCNGTVSVAVLDTGVQMDHPDLSSNILSGYAWDAINNCSLPQLYADTNGHGTHVAGLIAAVTNNSLGVTGTSFNAKIIPVRVADDWGYADLDDVEDAYEYLLNNVNGVNLKVINMSLYDFNNYHEGLGLIIQEAASEGIVTVCAGGNKQPEANDPVEGYPSDYDSTISVTATDSNNTITNFSIAGHHKNIAAPGLNIYSTYHESSYTPLPGTSMSSAIVSGVVALMFAANNNLNVDQVKNILYRTAVPFINPYAGNNRHFGAGIIDAKNAVNRAVYGPWKRLSGTSRYFTMSSIVEEGWEDSSCSTVIVATGASFPDALSGAALAGVYDCPIILTATATLSPGAQIELSRLNPSQIIILGSTSAVSSDVENAIGTLIPNATIRRLQGSTRYETCFKIYQDGAGNWSDTLILATGATAPDALSVSSFSYASKSPVFLVQSGTTLTASMQNAITSGAFSQVVILGAPDVVSTSLENWVKTQVGNSNVIRLYGNDRYQTSSQISEWASGNMPNLSVQPETTLTYRYPAVANGGNDHFADALSSGPFCGHNGSVILLTQDSTTNNYTVQNNAIPHKNEIQMGFVIGASNVLSENFRAYLNNVAQ